MPHTDGRWTAGTATPGFELFVGATEFTDVAGVATVATTIATPGLVFQTVGSGAAAKFVTNLKQFLREAVYATPGYDQSQFGTAAAQPGPSAVANTSGPLALPAGFPPFTNSQLPTVSGNSPVTGAAKKGLQIESVTPVYQVLTDATAVAATIGLTTTVFANLAAPVVANLIALGANSLPVIIGAQPQLKTVAVASPAMTVGLNTEILLNINLTGGTAGTIKFYGAIVKGSYNFQ